ncbi:Imm40 family immunity protein [Tengunoibacter tsumagoiensis]|uniref:Immunity protein 40 domain-containing protein n=1 Tax=Tengunoibacter tsumagoiensis TaxID=2014871 RepID=A0A401ZWC5_9CHLR|nr:Imm40 family immunity protein [Tengunoibacter tsumagoiensis]GCE11034.1 hypothetical protein KTT_08930 [Tengunoibacter tsumagoiensis]
MSYKPTFWAHESFAASFMSRAICIDKSFPATFAFRYDDIRPLLNELICRSYAIISIVFYVIEETGKPFEVDRHTIGVIGYESFNEWGKYVEKTYNDTMRFIQGNEGVYKDSYYSVYPIDEVEAQIRHFVPPIFTDNLYLEGFSLNDRGFSEVGWLYKDIFEVLSIYQQEKYKVLGGDVYRYSNRDIFHTYDSWSTDSFKNDLFEKGYSYTFSYIENYYKLHGDSYIYTLTVRR